MHTSACSHPSHAHARPLALFPPMLSQHAGTHGCPTHARLIARVLPAPYGSDLAVVAPVPDPMSPHGSPRPCSTHTDAPTFALIAPIPFRTSCMEAGTGTCPYGCRPRPHACHRWICLVPPARTPTLSCPSHPLPTHTSPACHLCCWRNFNTHKNNDKYFYLLF